MSKDQIESFYLGLFVIVAIFCGALTVDLFRTILGGLL